MLEKKEGFVLILLNVISFVQISYCKSNLCKIELLFEFIFYFKIKSSQILYLAAFLAKLIN